MNPRPSITTMVRLAALLGWLLTATACSCEMGTEDAERFLKKVKQIMGEELQFDRVVLAKNVGLSVSITTVEPQLLLGMPLLFKIRIENGSSETHRVPALDCGENGLWLVEGFVAAQIPYFVLVDPQSESLFHADLGERKHHVSVSRYWESFDLYRNLRPLEAVQGEFDISPVTSLDGGRWSQRAGSYQFLVIWFDKVSDATVAVVARTDFEVKVPAGEDALAWKEISAAVREPLSPFLTLWDPKLERIAETFPLSSYTKYIYFLKAPDIAANASTPTEKGFYASAAAAYDDVVRRYPDWVLTDDALLGYARSLYRQAVEEDRDRAPELLTAARDTLRNLPARYPDTNCWRAGQRLLRDVEQEMAKHGLVK